MIAFGPVPSRRLGRSLGINNIPPKHCTYSCVYCQVGRTTNMEIERRKFYPAKEILASVREKVELSEKSGEPIDYLTFVPDGEPTLDIDLGEEIEGLKGLGIKIAVITNSSLLSHEDVRQDLSRADLVSLKVDSVEEPIWKRVNRPHGALDHSSILKGMTEFAQDYKGKLLTETMLVRDLNDDDGGLRKTADFIAELDPDCAYLSIPTRPPAEHWAHAPSEATINRAYQIMKKELDHVEYLVGYEGNAFASTGDAKEDLLSITAVHPMRREALTEFLAKARADWSTVDLLLKQDQLAEVEHEGSKFYVRRFRIERG
ncbi:MAG: radical SAM protein [Candidatus Thermoplasmatota archaeon]|nr:radical SAM protein [Candidatus Thermoplasmatota archaeon]